MDIESVCDRIRQDYASFPDNQSYDLYAEDVFFQDPLNRFKGVKRYQEMIRFIERWFEDPNLELHVLEQTAKDAFQTRWTLSWITPLPWKPYISIPGWTDYRLNSQGKITSHIDHWNCSRLDVLGQVFGLRKP
ncbi:DUF2358 domain-containing protein [Oscillatoria sp. CS-180]|uniref:DUF2358 domain-containing protein n=1 Tax=Oscillatoria sp. CS-180 TaxID=3021720 RepID=UPI00232F6561|nr:DUF2358 domain-containing protein [Oscillatoria sp. CS-180]MDB9528744.1 DUF2358 domain-containing protein [Oscillatoria sp. CS-180]